MGFSLVWAAVRKPEGAELLQRLGLERVGDASDELGAPYCCAETPEGWLVLTLGDDQLELDRVVSVAPPGAEILGFEMFGTVMFSRGRAFRDGSLIWSVTHDAERDRDGVIVEGENPSQLMAIRTRLEAEEAADAGEGVDHLFDIPLELSRELCGYRPEVFLGLEWSILQKISARRATGPVRRRRSLLQGMRSELIPLLRSLGWEIRGDKPDLSGPGDISRTVGGVKQRIWFDYGQGDETYITVELATVDGDGDYIIVGRVTPPRVDLPWWKRFSWRRFVALTQAPPAPQDVGSVLEQARRDVLIADTFLRTGETNNCISGEIRRPPPQPAT